MASFDREIPPGGEGKITLSVKTKGYEGARTWSAKVDTNDPDLKIVTLTIKSFVKVPIYRSPRYVSFHGFPGQSHTRIVEIKAGLEKPLVLTPGKFNLVGKLTYKVEEVEKGNRFLISFTTLPGPPQAYDGFLTLKTNYPEKPEITIRIRARLDGVKKG